MWVKTIGSAVDPEYVNLNAVTGVYVRDYPTAGEWNVYARHNDVHVRFDVGPYTTEAEAIAVMRKIIGGIDLRNDLGY